MTQFDRNQAEAFLKVIDPGAAGFTFQTFDDSPHKRPELARVFHASIDGAWDDLCRLSRRGAGIFVTVNETDGRGRKAENIVKVRALFCDLDGEPLKNCKKVPLHAGWVTNSSPNRWHVYWKVDGIELSEFTSLQKEIINLTGGDKAIHDLSRVMRLPGLPHRKNGVYLPYGWPTGLPGNGRKEVAALLPPPAPPRQPAPRAWSGNGYTTGDATRERRYALAALERECAYVAAAQPGTRNCTLNEAAFALGTLLEAGRITEAEAVAALTNAGIAAGLHPNEIDRTIRSGLIAGAQNPRSRREQPPRSKSQFHSIVWG